MASLAELIPPVDGAEYLDLDALVRALDDWAVKDNFSFRTKKREAAVAVWVCAEEEELECRWRCRAHVVGEDLFWIFSVIEGVHTCVGRGNRKRGSSSKHEWLDPVVSRHLNVTKKTTPQEIVDLLRVRFAETISYKVAQLCRLRLLDSDIGAQRHSFQLLPAYQRHLEAVAPETYVDLLRDQHRKSLFLLFSLFITIY